MSNSPTPPPPPPGWYPDPSGSGKSYWDGERWGQPPKRGKFVLIAVGALLVMAFGISIFSGNKSDDKSDDKASPATNSSADGVTAEEVFWAIREAGLPATDPRDNSQNMCGNVGCVQLMTTDDVSIYQFPDPDSAAKWASGFESSGYRNGTIFLRFNVGGSNPIDVANIPRYKDVLDGVMGG